MKSNKRKAASAPKSKQASSLLKWATSGSSKPSTTDETEKPNDSSMEVVEDQQEVTSHKPEPVEMTVSSDMAISSTPASSSNANNDKMDLSFEFSDSKQSTTKSSAEEEEEELFPEISDSIANRVSKRQASTRSQKQTISEPKFVLTADDDQLLYDILGPSPTKTTVTRTKPPRKQARTGATISSKSSDDMIDHILAQAEADEAQRRRLQEVIERMDKQETSPSSSQTKPQRLSILTFKDDQPVVHEATHYMPFFTESQNKQVSASPQNTLNWISVPAKPLSIPNDPNNQKKFDTLLSNDRGLHHLPNMIKYLKSRSCPPNVAEWLLELLIHHQSDNVVTQAYGILLSLLPVGQEGFPMNICHRPLLSQPNIQVQNFPFDLSWNLISSALISFGASFSKSTIIKAQQDDSVAEEIAGNADEEPGLKISTLIMRELEAHAHLDASSLAASKACHQQKIEFEHSIKTFRRLNFAYFSKLLAAFAYTNMLRLQTDQIVFLLSYYYRAIVDPNCQTIVSDIQTTILYLWNYLCSVVPQKDFSVVLVRLFSELYSQLSEPNNDVYATLYYWVLLTPASSDILAVIRASMAYYFLHRQLFPENEFPTPNPDPSYILGTHLVKMQDLIELLNSYKFPKDADWRQASFWVLLIDIATSNFKANQIHIVHKDLASWSNAFSNFHKQGKEKGSLDISLTKFKDYAVHVQSKTSLIELIQPSKSKMDEFLKSSSDHPDTLKQEAEWTVTSPSISPHSPFEELIYHSGNPVKLSLQTKKQHDSTTSTEEKNESLDSSINNQNPANTPCTLLISVPSNDSSKNPIEQTSSSNSTTIQTRKVSLDRFRIEGDFRMIELFGSSGYIMSIKSKKTDTIDSLYHVEASFDSKPVISKQFSIVIKPSFTSPGIPSSSITISNMSISGNIITEETTTTSTSAMAALLFKAFSSSPLPQPTSIMEPPPAPTGLIQQNSELNKKISPNSPSNQPSLHDSNKSKPTIEYETLRTELTSMIDTSLKAMETRLHDMIDKRFQELEIKLLERFSSSK